ncbi:MAG: hypothetical protein Q8P02_03430 [Candidatus Micrarchaeota archaeon]|nr:hypothetical protein [Candidatus Micrarchaeota archaeon]
MPFTRLGPAYFARTRLSREHVATVMRGSLGSAVAHALSRSSFADFRSILARQPAGLIEHRAMDLGRQLGKLAFLVPGTRRHAAQMAAHGSDFPAHTAAVVGRSRY